MAAAIGDNIYHFFFAAFDSASAAKLERVLKQFPIQLSMGGYGSLISAMRHPDVFAACAAFSAAVHTEEEVSNIPAEKYNEIYAHLYSGEVSGKQRITEHWEKYSPYYLAKTLPK
jgi:S-formylglutathione hydrolase FrmB